MSTQRPASENPGPQADPVLPPRGASRPIVSSVRTRSEPGQRPEEPFPLVLERRARHALRTHVTRSVVRTSTLVTADLVTFLCLRFVVERLAQPTSLHGYVASLVASLVPRGAYSLAQLAASIVLGLFILGNYGAGDDRRDSRALVAGSALGLGLLYWNQIWVTRSPLLIIGFGVAIVVLGTALVAERMVVDKVVRLLDSVGDRRARKALRTLVVSSPAEARQAGHSELLEESGEFVVVGYLDVGRIPAPDALGGIRDLIVTIAGERVDTVVIGGQLEPALFEQVVEVADSAGCQVLHLPPWMVATPFEPRMVWRRSIPAISLTRPGLRGQQLVVKRFVDIGVSVAALVMLAPLLALIGIAVKLSSRGPVFFRQARVGLGGATFRIYKFRTMAEDAEERREQVATQSMYADSRLFKIRDDPRVTRLGRFLRRTSLDELPQLWNVVRGEMSLVGPRPPIPTEVALYEEHHFARLCMRPGITGPWQVGGRNNLTDFEEIVRLEASYMRRWTIWRDVEIMLRTASVVLRMDGAH
jgi:exopolysaccharide biosynthesis polyprenyl glycosylphosphotransferase